MRRLDDRTKLRRCNRGHPFLRQAAVGALREKRDHQRPSLVAHFGFDLQLFTVMCEEDTVISPLKNNEVMTFDVYQ